jgi:hypothetical protein
MDITGTAPAGNGRRYFQPHVLPGPDDLDGDWHELRTKYDAAYDERQALADQLSRVKRDRQDADRNYAKNASAAKRAGGKVPKDPRPGLEEQEEALRAELEVLDAVVVDMTQDLDAFRESKRDYLAEIPQAMRDTAGDRAELQANDLEETVAVINRARWIEDWVQGRKHRPAVGVDVIAELQREIRDTLSPPRTIYLNQAQHRLLRAGEDATDLDGNAVPFAETDKAYREGRVRLQLVHGKPRHVAGIEYE